MNWSVFVLGKVYFFCILRAVCTIPLFVVLGNFISIFGRMALTRHLPGNWHGKNNTSYDIVLHLPTVSLGRAFAAGEWIEHFVEGLGDFTGYRSERGSVPLEFGLRGPGLLLSGLSFASSSESDKSENQKIKKMEPQN